MENKNITFNKEDINGNTFLIHNFNSIELIDTLEYSMISNNNINNLLNISFGGINDNYYYRYDITGLVSIKEVIKKLSKKNIISVLEQAELLNKNLREHLLDEEHIVFDLNWVFINPKNLEIYYMYIPSKVYCFSKKEFIYLLFEKIFEEKKELIGYLEVIKEILNKKSSETTKNIIDFYSKLDTYDINSQLWNKNANESACIANESSGKIYGRNSVIDSGNGIMNKSSIIDENDIEIRESNNIINKKAEVINIKSGIMDKGSIIEKSNNEKTQYIKIKEEKNNCKKNKESNYSGSSLIVRNIVDKIGGLVIKYSKKPRRLYEIEEYDIENEDYVSFVQENNSEKYFGETMLISRIENSGIYNKPYLIRSVNKEKISIDKDFFKIGKEPQIADYVIHDNVFISRFHAELVNSCGSYYIKDCCSKNHVFVNDIEIPENRLIKIVHNDRVVLGNEEFVFKQY